MYTVDYNSVYVYVRYIQNSLHLFPMRENQGGCEPMATYDPVFWGVSLSIDSREHLTGNH
jgi:hypothetical protein